jgi:hypothetical protein
MKVARLGATLRCESVPTTRQLASLQSVQFRDVRHGNPNKFFGVLNSTGLRSLLGVAIELPESPLSFRVAIRGMGGFVSVVLAHSMQSLFYGGCSHSTGLRMEQLREFE